MNPLAQMVSRLIAAALVRFGGSQAALSRASGVPQGSVSKLKDNPTDAITLATFAAILDAAGGDLTRAMPDWGAPVGTTLPVVGVLGPSGGVSPVREYLGLENDVWGRGGAPIEFLRVSGDGLAPAFLDGDLLACRKADSSVPDSSGLAVVQAKSGPPMLRDVRLPAQGAKGGAVVLQQVGSKGELALATPGSLAVRWRVVGLIRRFKESP